MQSDRTSARLACEPQLTALLGSAIFVSDARRGRRANAKTSALKAPPVPDT